MRWILLLIGLIILVLSAGLVSASDRVIVDDFEDTYYMNDKESVKIQTTITIVGDDLNGNAVPIYINFYEENGVDLIKSYEIENEIIAYQTGTDKWGHPVYKYKNYTGDFGFITTDIGEIDFRLVVNFNDFQDYNEVHHPVVNAGRDPTLPDPDTGKFVFSGTVILILVIIVMLVFSGAGVAVKYYPRKDLTSKDHLGMDIEAGDTELVVEMESNNFKKVPGSKKIPVLESKTSQSEIDME